MISYQAYLLAHVTGILLLFLGLGGRVVLGMAGAADGGPRGVRVLVAATHGVGLFLILLGGFGLMARTGISHGFAWPGWLWVKLGVWVAVGAAVALPLRYPALARPLWLALPALGALAAYMALFKPF